MCFTVHLSQHLCFLEILSNPKALQLPKEQEEAEAESRNNNIQESHAQVYALHQ